MRRKGIAVFLVMMFCLGMASICLAEPRYSNWIPTKYPNVYYQIANWSGGDEAEGVRWANQNSYRVKVTIQFYYRPTKVNVGEQVIYVEGGNSYSEFVKLGPKVDFYYTVDRD